MAVALVRPLQVAVRDHDHQHLGKTCFRQMRQPKRQPLAHRCHSWSQEAILIPRSSQAPRISPTGIDLRVEVPSCHRIQHLGSSRTTQMVEPCRWEVVLASMLESLGNGTQTFSRRETTCRTATTQTWQVHTFTQEARGSHKHLEVVATLTSHGVATKHNSHLEYQETRPAVAPDDRPTTVLPVVVTLGLHSLPPGVAMMTTCHRDKSRAGVRPAPLAPTVVQQQVHAVLCPRLRCVQALVTAEEEAEEEACLQEVALRSRPLRLEVGAHRVEPLRSCSAEDA